MGYYIEVPEAHNKAEQLVKIHGAEIIPRPNKLSEIPADKALICVVVNFYFDAAAYVYNEREFQDFQHDFTQPDRSRTWLLMDKVKARKLSGYVGPEHPVYLVHLG